MNWLSLPSLSALRAFAALAEHGSLTRAGEALNVSHAAVGQQLRALERHLGTPLAEKSGRSLALTPEGRRLARVLAEAFGSIAQELAEITGADATRPLNITTTPTFAAAWLVPRIADFHSRHPEIDLMLNTTPEVVKLAPGGVDIAIRFGTGDWPGLDVSLLMPARVVVVASRKLVGDRVISQASELLEYPLLQELGLTEVTDWLQRMGVPAERFRGVTYLPGNMVLDEVRRGSGIATTTDAFIRDDVEAGRLRILFRDTREETGYHIVTRPGMLRPPARAFARWLRRQVPG